MFLVGSYSNLKPKGHDLIDMALLPHSIIHGSWNV